MAKQSETVGYDQESKEINENSLQLFNAAKAFERKFIGNKKKHAFKKYDQFALNTSCFWGSTTSNINPVVQFHEIFVTKIMYKLFHYIILLLLKQKFREIAQI